LPIEGSSIHECAEKFRQHLSSLLSTTITGHPLRIDYRARAKEKLAAITFVTHDLPDAAPLKSSSYPGLRLQLSQKCRVDKVDGKRRYQLRTVGYRYALLARGAKEPFVRWEYAKTHPLSGQTWCRHHIQGPIDINIGPATVSLEDFHVPTGFVTIEEIVQFCLSELEVTPLSTDWYRILQESYEKFRDDFRKLS